MGNTTVVLSYHYHTSMTNNTEEKQHQRRHIGVRKRYTTTLLLPYGLLYCTQYATDSTAVPACNRVRVCAKLCCWCVTYCCGRNLHTTRRVLQLSIIHPSNKCKNKIIFPPNKRKKMQIVIVSTNQEPPLPIFPAKKFTRKSTNQTKSEPISQHLFFRPYYGNTYPHNKQQHSSISSTQII